MVEVVNSLAGAIVMVSCLVALLIGAVYTYVSKPLKILGIYFVFSATIELLGLVFSLFKANNLYLFHLFSFVEIILLSFLFGNLYRRLGSSLRTELIAIPISIIIILNTIFIQGIKTYNSYSSTLVSMVIIGYCIYYFALTLDKPKKTIQFKSIKWAIICIFLYHCISVIVLFFSNVLLEVGQTPQLIVWAFRAAVILITKVILLIIFGKLLLNFYYKPSV